MGVSWAQLLLQFKANSFEIHRRLGQGLKICILFAHKSQIFFFNFFCFVNFYSQWVFRERNSSCSFRPIALKLRIWLGHGLKMCILFAHKSQIHFSRIRGPWFMPKIGFRSISCERIDGLGSYFAYILLLTIPSLGFHQFSAELLALIYGQKWYPLNINILWNNGQV